MARRYARDNRGRFAPKGAGATARGGRLKTASGKKRATQTMQASAAPKGTIGKPKGLKPGAIKAKPAAKATKPSREARLNRAAATATRIAKSRKLKADTVGAAFAERRRISSRASSKARSAAFAKEATAGKQSATAMRSWLRAEKRAESLRGSANQARFAAQAKPASKPAAKNASRAAANKPAATTSKLGARLNPAKKADRRAKQDFNKAYNRENRIRASLFSGNKTQAQKEAITKELNKASNLTASKLQQRREVRAQFPVQAKDKLLKASKAPMSGAISKNKDVRNTVNRKAAFVRRVNRAGALPSNNQGRKGRQTARTRAKALATYQGARRPEISDATVGFLSSARRSPAFKPMASRLAAPSKAAQRSGKALANKAAGTARDKFGRRTMNPAKGTKKALTAARALKFYKNPKATAEKVLQNQGKTGKRTRGFRLPRGMR